MLISVLFASSQIFFGKSEEFQCFHTVKNNSGIWEMKRPFNASFRVVHKCSLQGEQRPSKLQRGAVLNPGTEKVFCFYLYSFFLNQNFSMIGSIEQDLFIFLIKQFFFQYSPKSTIETRTFLISTFPFALPEFFLSVSNS